MIGKNEIGEDKTNKANKTNKTNRANSRAVSEWGAGAEGDGGEVVVGAERFQCGLMGTGVGACAENVGADLDAVSAAGTYDIGPVAGAEKII